MTTSLESLVASALGKVRNERVGSDVLSAGMVRDLSVDGAGRVSFTFLLSRDDPATIVREARRAVQQVSGVSDVHIDVVEPRAQPAPEGTRPVAPAAHAAHAPPPPAALDDLGHIIAISSGKGGVGKSTIAANLAAQLARAGKRVGIMDADVYGPNIPRMFGVNEKPPVQDQKIIPLERYGVRLISLGFLVDRDAPAIWRGPIVTKIIQQFLRDVRWGKLDYFIVDLPPGTGDAQLSLAQSVQLDGAVIVTTPQEVAIGDALRGAKMFERVSVPVLGIVENMSWFACPHCGERTEIFLGGGGHRLATELGVPLLGQVPLQAGMADLADAGKPIVIAEPDSPAARALASMTREVEAKVGGKKIRLPILTG
ncbi:MAG TPA: Mrp/NBP35 family ATP-binding protein [Gemmatimonadales bacterium]|nr:Mrp/NBP35 family ATP-binding protein [Gemmatimonadales bacterium]